MTKKKPTVKAVRIIIYIGREREKRNDTSGENRQNRCIKNAKTHNSGKIAGEEKCMNERGCERKTKNGREKMG